MIYLQLFYSFLQIGLFSVGGGYAAIPLIQEQVVDVHAWLSMSEFTNLITIAEMTPGSIAVNSATFVGINIAGLPGAVIATLGCIMPSCILVSVLAVLYYKYKGLSALECVLSCLRPAVVALIAGAGLAILNLVIFNSAADGISSVNWLGAFIFAAAFIVLRKFQWNPILVMSICGFICLGVNLLWG